MTTATPVGAGDDSCPQWIAYEKNGRAHIAQAAAINSKKISLADGERVAKSKTWLLNLPPPSPAFERQVSRAFDCLSADALWRAAANERRTIAQLAARAACADDFAASPLQVAVLKCVLENPIYFRHQAPYISPTPADIVDKAQAAMAARREERQREDAFVSALAGGRLPDDIRRQYHSLLYAPERASAEHRALKRHLGGAQASGAGLARFFIQHGVLTDELEYWEEDFNRQWNDTAAAPDYVSPPAAVAIDPSALPRGEDITVSIDSADTREIDDALSVEQTAANNWRVGIHIAAPALTLSADDDARARRRQSSAYFPHRKNFMLPDDAIAAASLSANDARPVISLYLQIDGNDKTWRVCDTVIQTIALSHTFTPDADIDQLPPAAADIARQLIAAADCIADDVGCSQRVDSHLIDYASMSVRRHSRAGLSRMVEVFMRAANTAWAQRLAEQKAGGLFRGNGATLLSPPPGARAYMWLTSPLRRYCDLINQRLLLRLLAGDELKKADENWRGLQRYFSARHTLATRYQRIIETHWALKILQQQQRDRAELLRAVYLGDNRARLRDYPLVGKCAPPPDTAAGDDITVAPQSISLLPQQLLLAAQ